MAATYHEVQKMRVWWVYLVGAFIAGIAVWGFVQQVVFGNAFGNNPGPDWVLYTSLIFAIAINWLILSIKIELNVNSEGVFMRYFPFTVKKFLWREIKSANIVEYKAMRDYAGWGLRYNKVKKSKIYSISGNRALELTLKNESKVLIGTAKSEDFQVFLSTHNFLSE